MQNKLHTEFNFSLNEAIRLIQSDKRLDGTDWENGASAHTYDNDWSGASVNQAANFLKLGDIETYKKIENLARRYSIQGEQGTGALEINYDVTGEYPCVASYLSGEPEHMITPSYSAPAKVIDLMIAIGAMALVDANTLNIRGAAIFKLVRALELNGYSVGISACTKQKSQNATNKMIIRVKEPGEYISPAIVAYWIGTCAGFRRAAFSILERLPEYVVNKQHYYTGGGYGKTIDYENNEVLPNAIYLKRAEDNNNFDWFAYGKQELAKKGIIIN